MAADPSNKILMMKAQIQEKIQKLLTDFADAQEPTLPGDDALLNQAIASIQRCHVVRRIDEQIPQSVLLRRAV